jgi:hypothetical protein
MREQYPPTDTSAKKKREKKGKVWMLNKNYIHICIYLINKALTLMSSCSGTSNLLMRDRDISAWFA